MQATLYSMYNYLGTVEEEVYVKFSVILDNLNLSSSFFSINCGIRFSI